MSYLELLFQWVLNDEDNETFDHIWLAMAHETPATFYTGEVSV